jgi:DNA mismatch repair protein MSH4
VKHLFPETALSVLPRASFAAEKGYALLQDLCAPSPQSETTLAEVRQKYYALGAASAVIDWTQKRLIQTGKSRWERHTFNVKWLSVEGCMLIDRNTIMDLELINNVCRNPLYLLFTRTRCQRRQKLTCKNIYQPLKAISSKSKKSLFGLLNHTYTPMANRLVRSIFLALFLSDKEKLILGPWILYGIFSFEVTCLHPLQILT